MASDAPFFGTDPDDRARACIEQGLSAEEAGDHATALAELDEAERIAREAGLDGLVAAALINRGYVYGEIGEHEAALSLFTDAADVARQAGDPDILRSALINLGTALRLASRYHEAITVLSELVDLTDADSVLRAQVLLDRGLSLVEVLKHDEAIADFEEAERIAREADVAELIVLAHNSQGFAQDRNEDPAAALMLFEESVEIARDAQLEEPLKLALMNVAQEHRKLAQHKEADPVFAEAEELYRASGDSAALAGALYWHGVSLRDGGWPDRAIEKWREEEPLRRDLGQAADLADCLLAQAIELRKRSDLAAATPLLAETEAICRELELSRALAHVLHQHGLLLRAEGKLEEALNVAREAAQVADSISDPDTEARAQALCAMVLADLGDTDAAIEQLDAAETTSEQLAIHKLMIWVLARRAYVLARASEPAEAVTEQLRRAHQYAVDQRLVRTGRSAVRGISAEIGAACDDEYAEALAALKTELSEEGTFPQGG